MLTILRKITTRRALRRPLFYRAVHRLTTPMPFGPLGDLFVEQPEQLAAHR